jgi:hypothetical protein
MYTKDYPDHHDAELVLRLYELRRETVMRESRHAITRTFWPTSLDDVLAVVRPDHPLNAAFRQVGSYWEMVYGMAKHGVIHTDFLLESSGEGLFLFARVEPFLEGYRQATSPRGFSNAEWVANNSDTGRQLLEHFRKRVQQQAMAAKQG